jgi:hypothetical protein
VNPKALGDAEKALWKKIEPVLNNVLDELKANKKLETIHVKTEMHRLSGPIKMLSETSTTHNILIDIFRKPQEERSRFLQAIRPFGFEEANVIRMYLTLQGAIAVLSTEHFKLLLLFHMRDVSRKVSEFNVTMQKSAPRTWPQLAPFVDNEFRNALAHGTYAFVDDKIVLYKDATLIPFEELELDKFIIRSKEQNVLFHCLFEVLAAKKKEGFFT